MANGVLRTEWLVDWLIRSIHWAWTRVWRVILIVDVYGVPRYVGACG